MWDLREFVIVPKLTEAGGKNTVNSEGCVSDLNMIN